LNIENNNIVVVLRCSTHPHFLSIRPVGEST